MTIRLSEIDRMLLEKDSNIQWMPEDPRVLIKPYLDDGKMSEEEKTDLDKLRQKAQEVYSGYEKIIERCLAMEEMISEKCKNVVVTIDKPSDQNVLDALGRTFGYGTKTITFEMYKQCIKELSKLNNNVPLPEGV